MVVSGKGLKLLQVLNKFPCYTESFLTFVWMGKCTNKEQTLYMLHQVKCSALCKMLKWTWIKLGRLYSYRVLIAGNILSIIHKSLDNMKFWGFWKIFNTGSKMYWKWVRRLITIRTQLNTIVKTLSFQFTNAPTRNIFFTKTISIFL